LYSRLLEQAVKTMKAQLVATNFKMPTEDGRRKMKDESDTSADEDTEAAVERPLSSVLRPSSKQQPPVKVDEKVLVAPLVTLDLPLDAYLPPEYISDERVRLSVYQHMAEA